MTEQPEWLFRLTDLRRTANQPSFLELEHWTDIPRSRLQHVFAGRTLPTQEDLIKLLDALLASPQETEEVIVLARAARAEQRAQAGKPRPASPPADWQVQLQTLCLDGGLPSGRSIAEKSGLSHTYVYNILSGRQVPSEQVLTAIVDVLTTDAAKRDSILAAFRAAKPDPPAKPGRARPTPRRPTHEDFVNLTAALHELTEELRHHRPGQADHH